MKVLLKYKNKNTKLIELKEKENTTLQQKLNQLKQLLKTLEPYDSLALNTHIELKKETIINFLEEQKEKLEYFEQKELLDKLALYKQINKETLTLPLRLEGRREVFDVIYWPVVVV